MAKMVKLLKRFCLACEMMMTRFEGAWAFIVIGLGELEREGSPCIFFFNCLFFTIVR